LILIGPPRTGKTHFINYTFDMRLPEGNEEKETCCKKYTFTRKLDSKFDRVDFEFGEDRLTNSTIIYTPEFGENMIQNEENGTPVENGNITTLTIFDTPGFGEDTIQYIQETLTKAVCKNSTVVVLLFWKFIESETGDIERSLTFVNDLGSILQCEVQKYVFLTYACLDQPSKLPLKWRQKHSESNEELCQIWKQEREKFFKDKGFSNVLCVEMGEDEDKQKVYDFFSKFNITPNSFQQHECIKFPLLEQVSPKSHNWDFVCKNVPVVMGVSVGIALVGGTSYGCWRSFGGWFCWCPFSICLPKV